MCYFALDLTAKEKAGDTLKCTVTSSKASANTCVTSLQVNIKNAAARRYLIDVASERDNFRTINYPQVSEVMLTLSEASATTCPNSKQGNGEIINLTRHYFRCGATRRAKFCKAWATAVSYTRVLEDAVCH